MKIDVHTHILPKTWPNLRDRYGYGGWIRLEHHHPGRAKMMMDDRFFREIDANCWDPATRMAEMDAMDIDVQVLSTVPVMFGYWAKSEDAWDLAQILNDDMALTCETHPKRFLGLGSVPMQAPRLAVKELERLMMLPGMRGVQVGSHINEWNLDDEDLYPFWEACEDLGACIMVHPWDMMGRDTMPRHWLPWLVSMPAETSRAICSVLMGGLMDRFPGLRFMFAHGGGSFPATLGRIDHGFTMRPDLCQTRTKNPPSSYVDRIWIDSIVHAERSLDFVLDVMSAERIMLGSDYPFPLGELHPGKLIEGTTLEYTTKEQLLSGTALEWLGLDRASFETDASREHTAKIGGER